MSGFSGFCGLGEEWQCGFFGEVAQRDVNGKSFAVAFSGELYGESGNAAEAILNGFITNGTSFIDRLNGAFAIVIWDSEKLYLYRDRAGIKRLFYAHNNVFVFSTELTELIKFPGMAPQIDAEGLAELFAIGPARTPGSGVLKGVKEVLPGGYVTFTRAELETGKYWDVISAPHTHTYKQTLENTRYLLTNAVNQRMGGNVCSMLSGGLDSSIISAIAQNELKSTGKTLSTFSFDFIGNNEHFKGSAFQPDQDAPWAFKTAEFIGTNHTALECGVNDFAGLLFNTVDARGLPGMADVDSSLLYFLSRVSETHQAALTGECADELFGGYPWFHNTEPSLFFPWSKDMDARKALLSDDFLNQINLDAHAQKRYAEAIAQTPLLHGETTEQTQQRQISYLNLKHFMDVLCERLARTSQAVGILPRAPFSDHRLIEYIWNVPWEMKYRGGIVKSLLRESFRGILPDDILFRRKSPFPKSYNPKYEQLLTEMLNDVLNSNAPIMGIICKEKARRFMQTRKDLGRPWFGQLMAGPQMMAYILQVNYWLDKYNISLRAYPTIIAK